MVVNRGDGDALLEQACHDTGDLLIQEHEIAHHHRAVAHLLESRVRTEREASLHVDALYLHLQIRAGHGDTENVPWLKLSGLSEGLFDSLPLRVRLGSRRQRNEAEHGSDDYGDKA